MLATITLFILAVISASITITVFVISTAGDMLQLFARPPAWKTSLLLTAISVWFWLAYLGY